MKGDLRFGMLLSLAFAGVTAMKVAPRLNQGQPAMAKSAGPTRSMVVAASDSAPVVAPPKIDAKPASPLTDILPDGFVAAIEKETPKKPEPASAALRPSGSLRPNSRPTDEPKTPGKLSLPNDSSSPKQSKPSEKGVEGGRTQLLADAPKSATGKEPGPLVTEFVPFVEPGDTDDPPIKRTEPAGTTGKGDTARDFEPSGDRANPVAPRRDNDGESGALAPRPFPKPPADKTISNERDPNRPNPNLRPIPIPRASSANTSGLKSIAAPGSTTEANRPAKGKPVHPFYQRYLDNKEYFVRPEDTLENIAYRLYQDEAMAKELLRVNAEQIKQQTDLKPGMRLRLP